MNQRTCPSTGWTCRNRVEFRQGPKGVCPVSVPRKNDGTVPWAGNGAMKNHFQLPVYQRIMAEAQVSPPPKAASSTVSPSLIRPSLRASSIAMGMEAALVLATFITFR